MEINNLPQVDIVIPTFNSVPNIEFCLKRLTSQEYEGKTKIIIIDGGSTDSTLDICSRYGCEIHVYEGIYSNGLTGARNKSLELCNGDLYWQIDSDNFVTDGTTLSKLVEPFIKIEDLMIAVPMIDYNPVMSGIDKWLSEYEKFMLLQMAKSGEIIGNWSIVKDMTYGITNASLIRTKMIREVGGYDSDLRVLARAREIGLSKGVVVLDAFYYHPTAMSYKNYIKKTSRRIIFFGSLSENDLRNYFVPSSHDHTQRRNMFATQLVYIRLSIKMFRNKLNFWYWGYFLVFGYLLILLIHPKSFIRTLKKFL
jgi:glycosyltransferase involved in cell wall biosynthesis